MQGFVSGHRFRDAEKIQNRVTPLGAECVLS